MRKIPKGLKQKMVDDPYYKRCARMRVFGDHRCKGRITWEHAIEYKGRQLNKKWAILPICAYAHSVDQYQDNGVLDKEKHKAIALGRATKRQLKDISSAIDYIKRRKHLRDKYEIVGWGDTQISQI